MTYSAPARTVSGVYRRRRVLCGAVLALLLAVTGIAVAGHPLTNTGRIYLSPGAWPARGQAALVLGDGPPTASPHERSAPIASLAKVMTALVTLEHYPISPEQEGFTLTVTAADAQDAAHAAQDQSVVAVRPGEQLTERQLLEALLIPSGNNIAAILATRVAGSEPRFLAEMNAEARRLGMDHTSYTDPSGFDPSTVSTAADQLRVFQEAMRFPVFRQVVSMASVTLPVAGTVTNFDPLIAEGYAGKTGSDSAAGGCLAFFTETTVGGRRLTAVGVVMGQGEGSDTSALLAAAAEAAKQLVNSATPAIQRRRSLRRRDPRPVPQRSASDISPGYRKLDTRRQPDPALNGAMSYDEPTRVRRRLRSLAALATVGLICAGCSNTAAETAAGSGDGPNHSSTSAQKGVKFANCMRSNGVSNFPDPSGPGKVTIDAIANGSSIDVNSPAFKHALSACKNLEPAGFTGGKRSPEQQAAALRFAQCIRENGVADFPDPVQGAPLVDTNRIPSTAQPGGLSILNAAMQKCHSFAGAAGVHR